MLFGQEPSLNPSSILSLPAIHSGPAHSSADPLQSFRFIDIFVHPGCLDALGHRLASDRFPASAQSLLTPVKTGVSSDGQPDRGCLPMMARSDKMSRRLVVFMVSRTYLFATPFFKENATCEESQARVDE